MAAAADPCVYNRAIKVSDKELNHPGFLYPVNPLKEITFTHNHKSFLVVNGQIFDHPSNPRGAAAVKILEFVPSRYYRDNQRAEDAFYAAMHKELVKPANRVNILDSVSCLSSHTDICYI